MLITMITPIPGFSEPVSSLSHLLTAALGLAGAFFLIYRGRGNNNRVIGLSIYSFCVIFLFSMSGVYHLLEKGTDASYVLRILDYSGIFALIAGSFTPIHLILFRGIHRWLILMIVWTVAITGLTLTAIFFTSIAHWVYLTIFLSLGWMGLITFWKIYELYSKFLVKYLVLGGLSYSLGAVIEFLNWPTLWEGVIEPHEVFHFFVVIGAVFHWCLIYRIAKYPISSRVLFNVAEYPNQRYCAIATSEHKEIWANSREELKEKIYTWVEDQFHSEMRPSEVTLKFFQREDLEIR